MRQRLGSFFLLLLITLSLHAEYEWSSSVSKKNLYTNEAVELILRCEFSDEGYGYSIDIEGLEQSYYEIHRLSQIETERHGKRINEYHYLLFVTQEGSLSLEYKAVMKRTNKESIENSVIGRDNVEDLAFVTTEVRIPKLNLHVKKAPTLLVGAFELTLDLSHTAVNAYKPLNMTLHVKGIGNLDKLAPFELNIKDAEVFAEKPHKTFHVTPNGYEGEITQKFAIVSSKNYELPSFELRYFDLKTKRLKTLQSNPVVIEVNHAYSKEELLDEEQQSDTHTTAPLYLYVIIFIFGAVIGRLSDRFSELFVGIATLLQRLDDMIWRISSQEKDEKKLEYLHAIRTSKDIKSLTILLIVKDASKYAPVIEALQTHKLTLKEAKHRAILLT
jgi:hypothetical protein